MITFEFPVMYAAPTLRMNVELPIAAAGRRRRASTGGEQVRWQRPFRCR